MEETRWTKGPWKIGSQTAKKTYRRIDAGARWYGLAKVVVRLDNDPNPEGEANARLIAAAPDLYEALAELSRLADEIWVLGMSNQEAAALEAAWKKGDAALARARGDG